MDRRGLFDAGIDALLVVAVLLMLGWVVALVVGVLP